MEAETKTTNIPPLIVRNLKIGKCTIDRAYLSIEGSTTENCDKLIIEVSSKPIVGTPSTSDAPTPPRGGRTSSIISSPTFQSPLKLGLTETSPQDNNNQQSPTPIEGNKKPLNLGMGALGSIATAVGEKTRHYRLVYSLASLSGMDVEHGKLVSKPANWALEFRHAPLIQRQLEIDKWVDFDPLTDLKTSIPKPFEIMNHMTSVTKMLINSKRILLLYFDCDWVHSHILQDSIVLTSPSRKALVEKGIENWPKYTTTFMNMSHTHRWRQFWGHVFTLYVIGSLLYAFYDLYKNIPFIQPAFQALLEPFHEIISEVGSVFKPLEQRAVLLVPLLMHYLRQLRQFAFITKPFVFIFEIFQKVFRVLLKIPGVKKFLTIFILIFQRFYSVFSKAPALCRTMVNFVMISSSKRFSKFFGFLKTFSEIFKKIFSKKSEIAKIAKTGGSQAKNIQKLSKLVKLKNAATPAKEIVQKMANAIKKLLALRKAKLALNAQVLASDAKKQD